MKTIEVIPHRIGIDANGRRVSMYGAGVAHVVDTGKFTWRVVSHSGQCTIGLAKQPTDKANADKIAEDFASKFGFTKL